jgi:hypothetical protein
MKTIITQPDIDPGWRQIPVGNTIPDVALFWSVTHQRWLPSALSGQVVMRGCTYIEPIPVDVKHYRPALEHWPENDDASGIANLEAHQVGWHPLAVFLTTVLIAFVWAFIVHHTNH